MTRQQNPPREAQTTVAPLPLGRSQSSWLPLARRAWIGLALVLMVYFAVSIPAFYQVEQTVCTLPDPMQCSNYQINEGNVQALAQLHLTVAAYVGFIVALQVAGSLLGWLLGGLIFVRAARDWTTLFFSLQIVFGSATVAADVIALTTVTAQNPSLLPLLVPLSAFLAVVQGIALVVVLLTFPTGRITPRWSWVLILLVVVLSALPGSINPASNDVQTVAWILTYVGIVGVQVYRYARVFDPVQRQQAKWFIFALGVNISLLLITTVPSLVVPSLRAPDSWYELLSNAITPLYPAILIVSLGIAILRYRLWDIDVLINRALVYGSLTALLAGLYVALILTAQALVRALTGSLTQEPLVLVASTLAIAALFQPLRRRIQTTIDGRFYRRKYDAAQVVADFNSTLRQEVDLDDLRGQLAAVVEETMQPTQVLVWLLPADRDRRGAEVRVDTVRLGSPSP